MSMLSDDDVNLAELNDEELDAAWDLWFDLAQATNDSDPLYSHGVFAGTILSSSAARSGDRESGRPCDSSPPE